METVLPVGADPGRMKWRYLVAFLGVAVPWFLFVVWEPLGLAAWGACVYYLLRQRSRLAWGTLLCCPLLLWMGYVLVTTACDYQEGRAYLLHGTHAHSWDRRLHPVYRCYRLGECGFTRFTWWRRVSNNLAIRLMYRWLGPMPGAYHGPLPEVDEAMRVFKRTKERIPVASWKPGPLVLHGRTVTLGPMGCRGTIQLLTPQDREAALLDDRLLMWAYEGDGAPMFVDLSEDTLFTLDSPSGERAH